MTLIGTLPLAVLGGTFDSVTCARLGARVVRLERRCAAVNRYVNLWLKQPASSGETILLKHPS